MYLVAFDSTQQALLAEKRLKAEERVCKIIPTPREVDASCGISILTDNIDGSWIEGVGVRIYIKDEYGRWTKIEV